MTTPRRVYFHGSLKTLCPEPVTIFASSVAEAIKGVTSQLPAFRPDPIRGRHRVKVLGFDTVESLFEPTDAEEIHLVPALYGGKRGGFIQIALGAVLIAASFWNPIGGIALGTIGSSTLTVGAMTFGLGASLVIGGVMSFLAPKPPRQNNVEASKYLGAPKNTAKMGTRIPFGYGRHQVYGHYISFDIDAVDMKT